MDLRLWRAPLALLLWQVAPVGVQRDSLGRYRLSVGFETGQLEDRQLSCEGDVISARSVEYRAAGAQLDVWPSDQLRISGAGGVHALEGESGPFFGGAVAWEGRTAGIGAGVWKSDELFAVTTDTATVSLDAVLGPSVYLRVGNLDEVHVQLDVLPPTVTPGTTGYGRLALGFNRGHRRAIGGLFGIGVGPLSDEAYAFRGVGEVSLPVVPRVDLLLRGMGAPGAEQFQWMLGAGGRFSW